jgi:hypothetical protein
MQVADSSAGLFACSETFADVVRPNFPPYGGKKKFSLEKKNGACLHT